MLRKTDVILVSLFSLDEFSALSFINFLAQICHDEPCTFLEMHPFILLKALLIFVRVTLPMQASNYINMIMPKSSRDIKITL
jgi:hypothetical protein